jgi:hypothetical protein
MIFRMSEARGPRSVEGRGDQGTVPGDRPTSTLSSRWGNKVTHHSHRQIQDILGLQMKSHFLRGWEIPYAILDVLKVLIKFNIAKYLIALC